MTPTNDNTTAGSPFRCPGCKLNISLCGCDIHGLRNDLRKLQARVAEVEAERDAANAAEADWIRKNHRLTDERDAALSREKEAKAALRDLLAVVGKAINTDEKLAVYQAAVANASIALAQSGGADPAQSKGDE